MGTTRSIACIALALFACGGRTTTVAAPAPVEAGGVTPPVALVDAAGPPTLALPSSQPDSVARLPLRRLLSTAWTAMVRAGEVLLLPALDDKAAARRPDDPRVALLPHEAPGGGQLDVQLSFARRRADGDHRNELRLTGELGLRGPLYLHVSHPIVWLDGSMDGRGFGDLALGGGLRGPLGGGVHARLSVEATAPTAADVVGPSEHRVESRLDVAREWSVGHDHLRLWLSGGGGALHFREQDRTLAVLRAGGAADWWTGCWSDRLSFVLAADATTTQSYPPEADDHLTSELGARLAGCFGSTCVVGGVSSQSATETASDDASWTWSIAIGSRAVLAPGPTP